MNKRRIIERVAAGLRRCKTTPDYLIWIDNKEWIWDEPKILDIPVIVVATNVQYTPLGDSDLNFIPAWKDLSINYHYEFERGYENG
jgi:hypothetical protein